MTTKFNEVASVLDNKMPGKQLPDQQKGAVLVVSLIVLLVLTLMGVGGMNSSVMQERMASNAQNANREFQAAESAIGGLMRTLRGGTEAALQLAMNSPTSFGTPTPVIITGMTASVQTRYVGEIFMTDGGSMNANEDTPFLKGHRYELIGRGEMAGSGTPRIIRKGIERR